MPGQKFLGRADVEADRACACRLRRDSDRASRLSMTGTPDPVGPALRTAARLGARRVGERAEALPCVRGRAQGPPASSRSCRCAARDRIGRPALIEALRADDAARPPGAIDDDQGVGRRREVVHAQRQFAARHADAARNAHRAVFLEPARVEHDDVVARLEDRLHLLGRQRRRVARMASTSSPNALLGTLTSRKTSPTPRVGREAAVEHARRRNSRARRSAPLRARSGPRRRHRRRSARTCAARAPRCGISIRASGRETAKKRMRPRIRPFVAQVEQGDLVGPAASRRASVSRIDRPSPHQARPVQVPEIGHGSHWRSRK